MSNQAKQIATQHVNAKLCAAAPDMLAALQAMVDGCGYFIIQQPHGVKAFVALTMAKIAIAKATGDE